MDRRTFTRSIASFFASAGGMGFFSSQLSAREYLTVDQAQKILFGGEVLTQIRVKLTALQKRLSVKLRVSGSDVLISRHGRRVAVDGFCLTR